MSNVVHRFEALDAPKASAWVIFAADGLAMGAKTEALLGAARDTILRVAELQGFKGKSYSVLDVVAPQGLPAERVLVVGLGDAKDSKAWDAVRVGGVLAGALAKKTTDVAVFLESPSDTLFSSEDACALVMGVRLRRYSFDAYKTKKNDDDAPADLSLSVHCASPEAARKASVRLEAVTQGVLLARTLVNEPGNVLGPVEFAHKATELRELGVQVEVLDDAALEALGMRALLGVAQGSRRGARVAIMQWLGGAKGEAPLALVGKGVTFDTGGISIKPADKMEDMKGDMAGAAAVVGTMHALAARKAKANVVGLIGLVENMPDGNAQRPGDIVTSMSGQTIEIINTDAEGRLVLADVLWYAQERFKPSAMIDLATLTGAILVALAQEYGGLFATDDTLAQRLLEAGSATGEKLWRMPMGTEFDKMIDSRFADMKNSAGRFGGSTTAAQFLARFTNGLPWAHLDIAGVGMAHPGNDICKSWGSGFGVRLLDELVARHYETA